MEEASVPNKKIIISALSGIGIVLIFVLIFFLNLNSSTPVDNSQAVQNSPTTSLNNSNNSQNSFPTTNPGEEDSWVIYQNPKYSISYPKGWNIEEADLITGENGVKVRLPSDEISSPNLTIIHASTGASLSRKHQGYMGLGFNSDTITVGNTRATRLRGTLPPGNIASSSATNIVYQVTHIFIEKGGENYLIEYTYPGRESNYKSESIFSKIVMSFKLF